MNKSIGGYFGLELPEPIEEYHKDAICLNNGRSAFEYLLRAKKYKKVYLPHYTCDAMREPIQKLNIEIELYHIDKEFYPCFEYSRVKKNEVFVYTNYFGVCQKQTNKVVKLCENVIIDNAQAFFSKPISGIDSFYSVRKFFGVPDGGYLYTDELLHGDFDQEKVTDKIDHLIYRIDENAEAGYSFFKEHNESFVGRPIKGMSKFSKRVLKAIDYANVERIRVKNFQKMHDILGSKNKLQVNFQGVKGPLAYPYLTKRTGLKQYLISKNIFVPTYWPNVLSESKRDSWEHNLANKLIALPIDQRYGQQEVDLIASEVNEYEK